MARRIVVPLLVVALLLALPLVAAGVGTVLEIDTERDITINGIDT